MDYKKKITDYKPNVTTEAWKAMEELLNTNEKTNIRPVKNTYHKWISTFLFSLFILAISLYIYNADALENCLPSTSNKNLTCLVQSKSNSKKLTNSKTFVNKFSKEKPNIKNKPSELFATSDNKKAHTSNKDRIANQENINLTSSKTSSFTTAQNSPFDTSNLQNRNITQQTSQNSNQSTKKTKSKTINQANKLQLNPNIGSLDLKSEKSNKSNNIDIEKLNNTSSKPTINKPHVSKNVLHIFQIPKLKFKIIKPTITLAASSVALAKPQQYQPKFQIGSDIGHSLYLNEYLGTKISLFGLYKLNRRIHIGIQTNLFSVKENASYLISPEITNTETTTEINLLVQYNFLHVNRFDIGVEGAIGINRLKVTTRKTLNPEPNVILIKEKIDHQNNFTYGGGVFLLYRLFTDFKIGISATIPSDSEINYFSARVIYRL